MKADGEGEASAALYNVKDPVPSAEVVYGFSEPVWTGK